MIFKSAEHRLRAMGMAATILVLVALSSCGGSGRADPPTSTSKPITSVDSTTTTTQPPSSDIDSMPSIMNSLLRRWDDALTVLLQHPQKALGNPDDPARSKLAAAFTPGSPYITDLDKLLAGYSDRGEANRPGPSHQGQQSLYMRSTAHTDPNALTFLWCSFDDSVTYKVSSGATVNDDVGISQGEGVAVRQAGRWRLQRLRQITFVAKPAGTANPCPRFVSNATGSK